MGGPAALALLQQAEAVLLKQQVGRQRKLAERLLELNDRGLKLYHNGLFEAATDIFLEAYELMPTHPVVALNLLQSLTKEGGTNTRLSVFGLSAKLALRWWRRLPKTRSSSSVITGSNRRSKN